MRAFVAVEVPSPGAASRPQHAPDHLTLLFLGEIARDRVPSIVDRLTPVGAEVPPFDATLDGVGAFPSTERPRVVWMGMTVGSAEITELAHRIRAALAGAGEPDRREAFAPHLTLFRVRSGADHRRAVELLSGQLAPPTPRPFRVREFLLKESELSPRGATHRTVATFPLRGSAVPPGPTA